MTTGSTVIVGSRASRLARTQVKEWLGPIRKQFPKVTFKQRVVLEGGDEDRQTASLAEVAAKTESGSAFSGKQQRALLAGDVDVVVHSFKDLPTEPTPGLVVLPVPGPREDVRDVLCGHTLATLPTGARVGTGAQRRIAQLLALRPDIVTVPIRGNVPPRLGRLKGPGAVDAVLLAAAGLGRLGIGAEVSEHLDVTIFPPSPGQGALAIQIRADNERLRELLAGTGDAAVDAAVRAERSMLSALHGGCSVPVGAHAAVDGDGLLLSGTVTSLDGKEQVRATASGPSGEPEALGQAVARELLERGAGSILAAIRG
ncbi:hydroxymethylbilane synthase [Streptomyces sp. ISL-11]|uniref:hydroxymethylbilane synthase n=1 Tax=Streptomyces sp. ISL-11 TaxID=2819174 RepID=UPI001BE7BCEF|nr:hydroxymethylbilane synthase [Streptomyces sp. ISL-11]MBT2383840.1 hydroxymethylbilane synthase [Streptomyces sp. ISL-11]